MVRVWVIGSLIGAVALGVALLPGDGPNDEALTPATALSPTASAPPFTSTSQTATSVPGPDELYSVAQDCISGDNTACGLFEIATPFAVYEVSPLVAACGAGFMIACEGLENLAALPADWLDETFTGLDKSHLINALVLDCIAGDPAACQYILDLEHVPLDYRAPVIFRETLFLVVTECQGGNPSACNVLETIQTFPDEGAFFSGDRDRLLAACTDGERAACDEFSWRDSRRNLIDFAEEWYGLMAACADLDNVACDGLTDLSRRGQGRMDAFGGAFAFGATCGNRTVPELSCLADFGAPGVRAGPISGKPLPEPYEGPVDVMLVVTDSELVDAAVLFSQLAERMLDSGCDLALSLAEEGEYEWIADYLWNDVGPPRHRYRPAAERVAVDRGSQPGTGLPVVITVKNLEITDVHGPTYRSSTGVTFGSYGYRASASVVAASEDGSWSEQLRVEPFFPAVVTRSSESAGRYYAGGFDLDEFAGRIVSTFGDRVGLPEVCADE